MVNIYKLKMYCPNILSKNLMFYITFLIGALHAQLTVTLGTVEYPGYASDIEVPVIVNNPNNTISGMQFDMMVDPDIISPSSINAGGSPAGFAADMNQLSSGAYRILLFNAGNAASIPANSDTVMTIHFDGSAIASAVIDLVMSELIVTDSSGSNLSATSGNGMVSIGYVVGLSMSSDSGNVSEMDTLQVSMDNNGTVGGVQFDLLDQPDYISIDSLWATDRTTGFTISTTDVGSGTRILLYSDMNNDVAPGAGPILNVRYLIHNDAYGGDVLINFNAVTVSDSIGGIYWISTLDTGKVTVFPGYMEEPHNLIAVSGLDGEVPLNWDPPVGPIPPTVPLTIEILTDNYPGETSWDLVHIDGDSIVASIFTGELVDQATLYTWDLNIPSGGYIFTIYDSFGDGICCGWGEGYYRIVLNGTEIATGGEFEASESVTFNTSDGRFNIIQYSYLNSMPIEKELSTYEDREDFTLSLPFFVDAGIINVRDQEDDIDESRDYPSHRSMPAVSGYNLYRSSADAAEYQLIASVGADVYEYTDSEVMNGVTYYYHVTTDYSPEGTESGPSNIADATPVEWVELSISDGSALSGRTDTLDISINNEAEISFFYIEITDEPDYIIAESILPTNRTQGWTLDVTEASGVMVITGWGTSSYIASGSDPVCKVIVRGASMEPSMVDVEFTFCNIKDFNDVEMNWTGSDADFEVSVETQVLAIPNAVANPGDGITVPLMISNTQPVSAIQLSLSSEANYVSGVTVIPTDYMDFNDWYFGGNQEGNQYNIIITDLTLSNPILAGMGHIADIYLYVEPTAPVGNSVSIEIDKIVADANSIPMYTEVISPSVFVGTPMAHFSLDADITMSGYATETVTISLDNILPISVFEMLLIDMPDGLLVTAVNPAGRFADVGGLLLDNSGEDEYGNCFIFGYTVGSAIPAGSGPVVELSVQRKNYFGGHLGLFFGDVTARDENTDEVTVGATGYGVFSIALGTIDDIALPNRYTLYQNYPNPFNPVTVIQYDLPEKSKVKLTIYDLAGRQVRSLVNESQAPGLKTIVWDARDGMGNKMGAGVYIYQLKTDNYIDSKKMILVK